MINKDRLARKLGLLTCVTVMSSLSFALTDEVHAEEDNTQVTILGTTDLHGNIYNWSYENGEEVNDIGMA